jgi:uroporphyrin-III C-methyltransferase / precorrin-2 dehydrogenase / sirohydrochlorin ferrochelatase
MTLFPAFVKLQDRPVLVVGGGAIAASKIPGLLAAGAKITVVAPEVNAQVGQWASDEQVRWLRKRFEACDLEKKFLVVAATSIPDVNASVFQEADERQILCNAVDDIEHCHFYYGSIVQRGDFQIAISTNGKSPALAQRLRKEFEQQFGPEYAEWLDHLGAVREELRAHSTDAEATKRQLHELASRASFDRFRQDSNNVDGGKGNSLGAKAPIFPDVYVGAKAPTPSETINEVASRLLPKNERPDRRAAGALAALQPERLQGKVYLIGAGPGDPDLLTQKAVRLLQSADVVLHDSLVSREILALIASKAQRIDVGKRAGQRLLTQEEINALLVDAAQRHKIVVRLKGGDPLLFGRAAEEMEALRAAKADFEIVPGISAGFASAAAAQVSLTDRRLASRVLFTTFSRSAEARAFAGVPIAPDTTVVVYMPGPDYAEVSQWLRESGIVSETPCLVVSKASQPEQSVRVATVSQLSSLQALPAPALLIVGRVVSRSAAVATAADWLRQLAPEHRGELLF